MYISALVGFVLTVVSGGYWFLTGNSLVIRGIHVLGIGIAGLALAGFIVHIWKEDAVTSYRSRTKVICGQCDQYLGTGHGYDDPCPRCGFNRPVFVEY